MRKLEELFHKVPSEEEYFNILYSLADPINVGFDPPAGGLLSLYTPDSTIKDANRRWALVDRSFVLIGFAFIEDGLKRAIAEHFNPPLSESAISSLFKGDDAPFRDAASRIFTAHQLGIINDKQRDDLTAIRKIRNLFAHAIVQIDLSEKDVSDTCLSLNIVRQAKELQTIDFSLYPARQSLLFAIGYYVFTLKTYHPVRIKTPQA